MERPTEWAIERSLPDGRAAFHSAYRESYAVGWIRKTYSFSCFENSKKENPYTLLKIDDVLQRNPCLKEPRATRYFQLLSKISVHLSI